MTTLKNKVISGLAWSSLAKLIAQLLSWISTFVVIRYLNPSDYATVGLVFAFTGFFYVLSEFGLADALIQKKKTTEKNYSQVFSATLLLNTIIFIFFYIISTYFADFYQNSELEAVLIFVAANLLLSTFIVIPETLMNKEMFFKRRALIETFASTLNTVATLLLAILGFGFWSILLGQVVNTLSRVILFNSFGYRHYKITFDFHGFRSLFNFGAYTFASRAVWAFYNKLDILVIGRLFGSQILGVYTVAVQLASMPLGKISGTINQVAFSAFSQNTDNQKSKEHFLFSLRLLSLIVFPIFIGIAAISPTLVPILIGDKWLESIPIIQLLSLIMPLKLVSSFVNTYIASRGDAKFNLKMSLIYLVFISIGLLIGGYGDIIDTVIGLVVSYALCFLIVSYFSMGKINCSYMQFVNAIWRPIVCAFLMCGAIMLQQHFFMLAVDLIINLAVTVVLGGGVYMCCLFMIAKDNMNDLLQLLLTKKPNVTDKL